MYKSSLIALIALLIVIISASASVLPVVHIAANLPLTGELAEYGKAIQDGAIMAAEDLQKKNPHGPVLQFDWADNMGLPRSTVTILQRQYLERPDIYISGLKPQTMAITDQISQKGTPHFVWILDLLINRKSRNNFRTWINFKLESDVFLAYIKTKHPKRVAITYTNIPAPIEQYNQYVVPRLRDQGIENILILPYEANRSDFKDIAVKIREFKPDLLIVSGWAQQLIGQIRAFRPFGLIKQGNTLTCLDMLEAAAKLGPDETEGIVVTAPAYLTKPAGVILKNWQKRFQEKYGKEPSYHAVYAYDMVLVINDAISKLSFPIQLNQLIEQIRATDTNGVTGRLKFDTDGSLITTMEPAIYKNGQLLPL